MKYITEKEIDGIASETGKKLKKEKKVTIIIAGDGKSKFWEGGINGHFFRIKRDEPVEVPESVARLIERNARTIRQGKEAVKEFQGEGKQVN